MRRDPRIDPRPGDVVDMQPKVAPGKWTRHVEKVENGEVTFMAYFYGSSLRRTDTLEDWKESITQCRIRDRHQ